MKRTITTIITALFTLSLTGCLSMASPETIAASSNQELCNAYYLSPNQKVRAEIDKRGLIPAGDWSLIDQYRLRIGMPAVGVICAWGTPNQINRTRTESGESEQWVYSNYLGASTGSTYKFVYVEKGRVTAIQD